MLWDCEFNGISLAEDEDGVIFSSDMCALAVCGEGTLKLAFAGIQSGW